jgi:hypothetical protein
MKNLTDLLHRFSSVLNKKELAKGAVIEAVKKATSINLKEEKISINDGVLVIDASPVVKNEISFKEKFILTELKEVYSINITRILYK